MYKMPNVYKIILPDTCINLSKRSLCTNDKWFKGFNIKEISSYPPHYSKYKINRNWHKKRYGFFLSNTEINIFQMHIKAWEEFNYSNDNFCIIIEDKSLWMRDFVNFDDIIKDWDKGKWDVLFPFTEKDVLGQKNKFEKIVLKNFNHQEIKDYQSYLLGKKWGSFFYILSKDGVKKLLNIKQIRQNVDDELLSNSYAGKLNIYCSQADFLKYSLQPKLLYVDREKEIHISILKNNVWGKTNLKLARYLLNIISEASLRLNIDLILQGGTLLGYIQHNKLMGWDDDIDIGIEQKNINVFLKEIIKNNDICFDKFVEERSGKLFYKIWCLKGDPIAGKTYTFPFIDLWLYTIQKNDIIFLNGIVCTNSAMKKFKEIHFENSRFKIPHNSIECLDERYKAWKTQIRVYQWSHKLEKIGFFPLTLYIRTNRKGQLISPLYEVYEKK